MLGGSHSQGADLSLVLLATIQNAEANVYSLGG